MSARRAVTVHVVRHGKAESRKHFSEDDRVRPLTESGRRQADAISDRLVGTGRRGARRVLSSAAVRCVGTVAPLAAAWGVETELLDALAEGTDPRHAIEELVREAAGGGVLVACTHGDVLIGIAEALVADVDFEGPLTAPKASTWELDVRDGSVVAARFVPPPPAAPV